MIYVLIEIFVNDYPKLLGYSENTGTLMKQLPSVEWTDIDTEGKIYSKNSEKSYQITFVKKINS